MKEFLKSLGWKQWLCLVGIAWGLLLVWSAATYQGARVYCAVNPCYYILNDSTCRAGAAYNDPLREAKKAVCPYVTGPDRFPLR
jgi:hypothetical protein